MQEVNRKKTFALGLRAAFPWVLRVVAVILFLGGISFLIVSYLRVRNVEPFKMRSQKPELSSQVISRMEGFERKVTDGNRLRLLVRASVDVTYSDNHHELENVEVESYGEEGEPPDKIKAMRAVYMPGQEQASDGEVTFTGNVNVETKDKLFVRTESLNYEQKSGIIKTDVALSFTRENISGRATGAIVDMKAKRVEMHKDIEIVIAPEKQTEEPFIVRSAGKSIFSDKDRTMNFTGGATAEQGEDFISGERLFAVLNEKKKVQKVEAHGNAYLRSNREPNAAEISAAEMSFYFGPNQNLEHATATQNVNARTLEAQSQMQLTGTNKLAVQFVESQSDKSTVKEMKAEGRTTITLSAPQSQASNPRAANKRLIADSVKLSWRQKGRDLERAEAVGNAELYIEPLQPSTQGDKKTLTASRFDCEFFESGNLAKSFVATENAKAIIEPMQAGTNRQTRTLISDKMTAIFIQETQDLELLQAQGNAKFNEQDRNGTSANISYTTSDETVRMRGGEPTVWDSSARVKAAEIDWDTKSEIAYARGKVATTYYNQEKTNGATPFEKKKSPVYVTSDRAEYHQITNVGIYTGNARAWQDDNFVRADRLTLRGDNKAMVADGKVQSALYQAKKREGGAIANVPVFALAERMTYSDNERVVHYETNVDIRQGSDRVTCGVADAYLRKESNEVEKTVAQQTIVMTQPGRRGTGDWAQHTIADETFVLKGNPARVEDQESGTSEGGVITVNMRENKVVAQGDGNTQSGGRVRSTHIVKKP